MKNHIYTLQDTLALQLQGLYFAELRIKSEFDSNEYHIASPRLRKAMDDYVQDADEKLLKLDRLFNYLMQEPEFRKNKVIVKLLDDTREMLSYTDSPHLRNILVVSCLQNINAYNISCLKIAYMFTVELEMDSASDLLQQILETELETGKTLSSLAIEEFNKGHELAVAS